MSRCVGYAREAYIAYAFGAQQQTDAYIAAFTIPDILYSLLAGGNRCGNASSKTEIVSACMAP